jgi:diguanylate cyclase (GGDEF)-like protein/PAS domain S-box-containing protein
MGARLGDPVVGAANAPHLRYLRRSSSVFRVLANRSQLRKRYCMENIRKLVLLIDDDPAHARVFREALDEIPTGLFDGEWVRTLAEGLARLRSGGLWAVFLNLHLADSHGLATLDRCLESAKGVPTVVFCGKGEDSVGTEALSRGASDYLLEGHIDSYGLARAVRNIDEREGAKHLYCAGDRAQVTLNSIGDAVLSTDLQRKITYLNAVAEKITGWSFQEAAGKAVGELLNIIDSDTREIVANPVESAILNDRTVGLAKNCSLVRRDGTECAIEDSTAPIHDRCGLIAGAVMVFRDVSHSRAAALRLNHMAQHDVLTGLPNRGLLKDRVSQAIATAKRSGTRLAVMFLDLDGFKHVNDSLGHATGDKLLQSVGARLVTCVRGSDTVSRQGGDEFVILLAEIKNAGDAGVNVRKTLMRLAKPYHIDGHELHLTASAGLSTYPEDGDTAEVLFAHADKAMYQAKKSGSNNFRFFTRNLKHRCLEPASSEDRLRVALERGEFSLHYQPKVSLSTGAVCGVEALVRWNMPGGRRVLPLEFLPIAENCSLILPIGRWVLREACRQVEDWRKAGLPIVPVAVNVSSSEFRSDGFIENLTSTLLETCLDPRCLELELTETVLMQNLQSSALVLAAVKSLGLRLAVDDFGTGYSSLSYLKHFPVDSLKIDRTFVQDIGPGARDMPILRAVIAMARGLGKRVIAEGVERHEQVEFLQTNGCDEAQGFYFSKPVAAVRFAEILHSGIALRATTSFPLTDQRAQIS